mmetsp:Transcript_10741/g.26027  ORF Transcript_10741/g.26027 Transcript_10741/m.26027 type:complete len:94 (-) Transcript_10741:131-412(-)
MPKGWGVTVREHWIVYICDESGYVTENDAGEIENEMAGLGISSSGSFLHGGIQVYIAPEGKTSMLVREAYTAQGPKSIIGECIIAKDARCKLL